MISPVTVPIDPALLNTTLFVTITVGIGRGFARLTRNVDKVYDALFGMEGEPGALAELRNVRSKIETLWDGRERRKS